MTDPRGDPRATQIAHLARDDALSELKPLRIHLEAGHRFLMGKYKGETFWGEVETRLNDVAGRVGFQRALATREVDESEVGIGWAGVPASRDPRAIELDDLDEVGVRGELRVTRYAMATKLSAIEECTGGYGSMDGWLLLRGNYTA